MFIDAPTFDQVVAGRKVDGRTMEAKRFRAIGSDLTQQLGRNPTASERLLLMNAATIAMLCEQATGNCSKASRSIMRTTAATSRC